MRRARSRMEDVARLAGVSLITVSRVLREPERVAEETRARVRDAIAAVGYVPNLVARSLKSERTGIVAAIIPSIAHSIVAETIRGMTQALHEEGLHLLLADSGFSPEEEEVLVTAFLARRPDAMFLTGVTHTPGTRRLLAAAGIPVVETGNFTADPIDMVVGYSNVEAARAMALAMIERGRRRIGYIAQVGSIDIDRVQDRLRGHRAALASRGLEDDPSLHVEAELSYRGGAAALAALLARRPDVEGICCSSDVIAVGALFEAQRRGLAIPGELAIAGFDDQEIASQCVPAISTVRVPRVEMGRQAVRLICQRLKGAPVAEPVVDVGFELVVRETL